MSGSTSTNGAAVVAHFKRTLMLSSGSGRKTETSMPFWWNGNIARVIWSPKTYASARMERTGLLYTSQNWRSWGANSGLVLSSSSVYFVLPIYQMMRLQLLASAMQRHREMQADAVEYAYLHHDPTDLMDTALASDLALDCECSVPAVWSRFRSSREGFIILPRNPSIPLLAGTSPTLIGHHILLNAHGSAGSTRLMTRREEPERVPTGSALSRHH